MTTDNDQIAPLTDQVRSPVRAKAKKMRKLLGPTVSDDAAKSGVKTAVKAAGAVVDKVKSIKNKF